MYLHRLDGRGCKEQEILFGKPLSMYDVCVYVHIHVHVYMCLYYVITCMYIYVCIYMSISVFSQHVIDGCVTNS